MPNVYKNQVKVDGTWRNVTAQYVKVGGVWKTVTGMYTKVGGSWKTSFPFPVTYDATISSITVNGVSIASGGTYNVANSVTSVTLAATATNSDPTTGSVISNAISGTGTASGSVSVSYAGNPNTKTITVTANTGGATNNYTVNIQVAAPTSSVTIYYKYCGSGGAIVSGSYTDTTTTNGSTACGNRRVALGSPANWICGTTPVADPMCDYCPVAACCQADPSRPAYCTPGYGTYVPQYDPCCATSCSTLFYPGVC